MFLSTRSQRTLIRPWHLLPLLASLCLFTSSVPARAGIEQTVDELIPKLAAERVEDRYAPRMELQAMAANASRPGAEAERAALAQLLAAKAADAAVPQPARVWLVRQLELMGAAEAVPALTSLLQGQDDELRECARRALEKNPAPAAAQSLREAVRQAKTTSFKIGLLRSLGERRDLASVYTLLQALKDPETAPVAIAALGNIGNEQSVGQLWEIFPRQCVAEALLAAADRLLAQGDAKRAQAIYSRLYNSRESGPWRPAALNGWAKADSRAAKQAILAALGADDIKLVGVALTSARTAFGKNFSTTVAELLPKLSATAKTCVLPALDASAEKQIIQAAADTNEMVRQAALDALGQIGGAPAVPVLIKAAAEPLSSTQKAALAALARISGPGASAAIANLASRGEATTRAIALRALADRSEPALLPLLWKCARESDRIVSGAACAALGKTGSDDDLENLAKLALTGTPPEAETALQSVASRVKDKAAAAQKLVALTQTAQPGQLRLLFDTLSALGGDAALAAVSGSVSSGNEETKDAAIRALANWPEFTAVKPLLAIACQSGVRRAHNVLAVQGVVRLVKVSDKEPAAARVDAALAAMDAAARDEDKKLVLSAFAAVPNARSAEALKKFLADPKFKTEAGLAGASLAEAMMRTDRRAAKSLAQTLKDAQISDGITSRAEAVLKR